MLDTPCLAVYGWLKLKDGVIMVKQIHWMGLDGETGCYVEYDDYTALREEFEDHKRLAAENYNELATESRNFELERDALRELCDELAQELSDSTRNHEVTAQQLKELGKHIDAECCVDCIVSGNSALAKYEQFIKEQGE